jgi:hypothetical protein
MAVFSSGLGTKLYDWTSSQTIDFAGRTVGDALSIAGFLGNTLLADRISVINAYGYVDKTIVQGIAYFHIDDLKGQDVRVSWKFFEVGSTTPLHSWVVSVSGQTWYKWYWYMVPLADWSKVGNYRIDITVTIPGTPAEFTLYSTSMYFTVVNTPPPPVRVQYKITNTSKRGDTPIPAYFYTRLSSNPGGYIDSWYEWYQESEEKNLVIDFLQSQLPTVFQIDVAHYAGDGVNVPLRSETKTIAKP